MKSKLVDSIKKDINKYGPDYPILVTYRNDKIEDYDLSNENRVPDDVTCKQMSLNQLLNEIDVKEGRP